MTDAITPGLGIDGAELVIISSLRKNNQTAMKYTMEINEVNNGSTGLDFITSSICLSPH